MSSFTASKSALLDKGKPNLPKLGNDSISSRHPSLTAEGKQQGKSDSTTVSLIELDAREQGQDWQLTPVNLNLKPSIPFRPWLT